MDNKCSAPVMKCLAHLIPIFLGSIITRRKNSLNLYLKGDTQLLCSCNECCCWTTSSSQFFSSCTAHSTGTGGKFWIKGAIDELVQVWHLLLLYGGGRGRERWRDIIWSQYCHCNGSTLLLLYFSVTWMVKYSTEWRPPIYRCKSQVGISRNKD